MTTDTAREGALTDDDLDSLVDYVILRPADILAEDVLAVITDLRAARAELDALYAAADDLLGIPFSISKVGDVGRISSDIAVTTYRVFCAAADKCAAKGAGDGE